MHIRITFAYKLTGLRYDTVVRMSHSSSELTSGSRRLCDRLKFEEEEFFQVAMMDALVNEGWVMERGWGHMGSTARRTHTNYEDARRLLEHGKKIGDLQLHLPL